MDNRILVSAVILTSILLAVFIGVSVGSDELIIPIIVVIVLGSLSVIAAPRVGVFLAVALYASGLTAPSLPGQFGLLYVSSMMVIGCALILVIFRTAQPTDWDKTHTLLIAFCVILFLTGLYRGFGFQFLGSSMWGGFFYVQLIVLASLVLTMPRVNMPLTWWPKAIILMGVLAPMPLIADLLAAHGFSLGFIHLFMQTGATVGDLIAEQEGAGGLGRLMSAGIAAQSMIIAYLAVIPTAKLFRVRSALSIGLLLALVGLSLLSGFRLMTAMLLVNVFLVAYWQKTLTGSRVILGIFAVSVFLSITYATAIYLPVNVQRALSWLPGIDVSNVASRDAEGSISWRLDLWREAVHLIPEYFWIGKGFSYDGSLFLSARGGYASYDPLNWALVSGAYHNGYLSLILLTGIFGLITGLALMVMVVRRQLRIQRKPWKSPVLHRCYQAFFASQTCWVLVYLTVYGDVTAVFPQFFFAWAVMESLRSCDQNSSGSSVVADVHEAERDGEYAHVE